MEESRQFSFDFYLLIPYFNNPAGLIRSLESVKYDPGKFALLIVDDGSAINLKYENIAPHLPPALHVEIIRLPVNEGITKALNRGLQWLYDKSNFRFVARLDCGDICAEERFVRQVSFLQDHPDIGLLGTWCAFKEYASGHSYQYTTPTGHREIMRGMHFRNLFIHPTVMWRASGPLKAQLYPENYPHAEDYGLFYEFLNSSHGAIIPELLVTCEINPKGLSLHFRKQQLKSRARVVKNYGKNKFYSLLGRIKLWFLMVIPYRFVLQIKRRIYGIAGIDVIDD